MEIIEQIGSYAGLAAIVGLAVLSALYFSQARDVRRLRESEEDSAVSAAPERAAPAPGPKRPTAAVVPAPKPAQPAGATGKGQPAAGGPTQVRPPPPAKEEADEKEKPQPAAPAAGAGAATAAGAAAAAAGQAGKGTNAGAAQAGPATGGGNAAPASRPPPPRLPQSRPGATAAALRSSAAPSTTAPRTPWYRRIAPRYLILIVAGVVVLGAGGAYAVTALVDQGDESAAPDPVAGGGERGAEAPLDPSTITVAVLNGTDVAGLAAQVADTVESAGFQRGNVANATDQASAESAILYAEGARGAARQVGQELGIAQIEPIDEQTKSLAGTADVAVVVGADQAE